MTQPTMAEVARAAGVSKNTVSLALRGSSRVSKTTTGRVVAVAEAMGYRLNPTIAHLMAQLRKSRAPGYQATLAMLNAHRIPAGGRPHPTIPSYIHGCRERAQLLGYQLDEFDLWQRDMSASRWLSVLRARGIRGIVVVGMMRENRLPPELAPLWAEYPTVVTGVRTREPALSFACTDHFALALEGLEKSVELGYRRPALVLDGVIDELVEGRFTAGFLMGQSRLVTHFERTEPFHEVAAARLDRSLFANWLERNKPDVIFTLYHEVRRWLLDLGYTVPGDIGLIQYEWRVDHADWAGMDQRNDLVGAAALDMLVSMVHQNERGVPEHPRATMIGCHWVDGGTVRQ
jgi:LacI family transcriptional regulator